VAWEADAKMLGALLAFAEAQRGRTQEATREMENARALLRVKPKDAQAHAAAKDWAEEHQLRVRVEADSVAVTWRRWKSSWPGASPGGSPWSGIRTSARIRRLSSSPSGADETSPG
jgi:hypothetical protein